MDSSGGMGTRCPLPKHSILLRPRSKPTVVPKDQNDVSCVQDISARSEPGSCARVLCRGPVIIDKSDYFLSAMDSHTNKWLQAPLGMHGRKIITETFLEASFLKKPPLHTRVFGSLTKSRVGFD